MNMESMRVRSYRSIAADEHVPEEAAERYRTLKACGNLRAAGCNEEGALEQLGISRRTRYRRQAAPGPATGLEAQGRQGGDGRTPQVPVHGQGAQGRAPERVDGRPDHRTRPGRRRDPPRVVLRGTRQAQTAAQLREGAACAALARRWKYGSKARRPGELVQIDHMTYTDGGQTLKEFRAVCPVSKFMVTRVYSRATAGNAERFLMDVLGALPFPLLSVQRAACSARRGWQRVHGRVRGCLRGTARPAARPAAPEAPMEWLRGADKPLGADRVLEPLRRSIDRRERCSRPCPLRNLSTTLRH